MQFSTFNWKKYCKTVCKTSQKEILFQTAAPTSLGLHSGTSYLQKVGINYWKYTNYWLTVNTIVLKTLLKTYFNKPLNCIFQKQYENNDNSSKTACMKTCRLTPRRHWQMSLVFNKNGCILNSKKNQHHIGKVYIF